MVCSGCVRCEGVSKVVGSSTVQATRLFAQWDSDARRRIRQDRGARCPAVREGGKKAVKKLKDEVASV